MSYYGHNTPFDLDGLIGKTMVSVEQKGSDELHFVASDGTAYMMYHSQDCCEQVDIEDICGELSDLIGSPLVMAECVSNTDGPAKTEYDESHTWTFYKFGTVKGSVTIRWYGASNGYYSESVEFEQVKEIA